jgi:hypothetical protein
MASRSLVIIDEAGAMGKLTHAAMSRSAPDEAVKHYAAGDGRFLPND